MKRHEKITLTIIIFLISMTIIITPIILPVFGVSGNTTTFNVTLSVNSGSPTITYVQAISDSPNEGTTKIVSFYFNATHPNGRDNIPAANANIQINQSGTTLTKTGSCIVKATDGITLNMYECNITIQYYTAPGDWTINATIIDLASNVATNTTKTYANGYIYGVVLKNIDMSFSGAPGTNNVEATQNPQYVNNTGNVAFSEINLTAYNLQSGSNFMGVGNFTANTTNSTGPGQSLINNTVVKLTDSSIAINGTREIYIFANIPTGLANGTYTNIESWRITVG